MGVQLDREYARWYPLIDHPEQLRLISDNIRVKLVPAGRRCLEAGTLVATNNGPVAIEKLKIGDGVIGYEDGRAVKTNIIKVYENGLQQVYPLYNNSQRYLAATSNHELCTDDNKRIKISDITNQSKIKFVANENKQGWIILEKRERYLAQTYDITVSNTTNLYILYNGGIVTSNSGKTERAKRYLAKQAMKHPNEIFFASAPTRDQAKKIWWKDLKLLTFSSVHARKPLESELILTLPNKSEIHVIGLDVPSRIEGTPWSGGVIDEIANVKEDAWNINIMPALDTFNPLRPDYKAWCWLIGVPEGLNHYHDMCEYAPSDPDWKVYTWFSSDILPAETIAAARRVLSLKQFKQEYEGSFETAAGRIYDEYSPDNYTDETIKPQEQLLWHHDFNYTPLSSGIAVRRGDSLYILDEIILTSAVSRQSALEFIDKYKNHKNKNVILYGDPAGRAGEKHGHASDYTDMEDVLRSAGWKYERRVKRKAPAIKDRQNAVRAKIRNAAGENSLFVNTKLCPYTHKGLSTVQFKKGSTFLEEETDYQHITTAFGYMIDFEFSINRPVYITGIGSAA